MNMHGPSCGPVHRRHSHDPSVRACVRLGGVWPVPRCQRHRERSNKVACVRSHGDSLAAKKSAQDFPGWADASGECWHWSVAIDIGGRAGGRGGRTLVVRGATREGGKVHEVSGAEAMEGEDSWWSTSSAEGDEVDTSFRVYVRNENAQVGPCDGEYCRGRVQWWNSERGFGVIRVHHDYCESCGGECDGVPREMFVRRNDIHSRPGTYPRLYATEYVEFYVREDVYGRPIARRVTGRGGSYVKDRPSTDLRVYTDGACIGNPGPGGWAYCAEIVASMGDETFAKPGSMYEPEHQGANLEYRTTNQAMELKAALEAVWWANRSNYWGKLEIVSDSAYLVSGAESGGWMDTHWKHNGWTNASGQPLANKELWQALLEACSEHGGVTFTKVQAHSGIPGNELADRLARAQAESARTQESTVSRAFAHHSVALESTLIATPYAGSSSST